MGKLKISEESIRRIARVVESGDFIDRIVDVYGHLSAAIVQSLPSDDQIIIGHIQDALDIIEGVYRELVQK